MPNYLAVKWSVSRGRDTYGYNICTLTDTDSGKRYRCNGGGYDMLGTVFGEWLEDNYQAELVNFKFKAHQYVSRTDGDGPWVREPNDNGFYGMTWYRNGLPRMREVGLDGGCGLSSMEKIAQAIGLDIKHTLDRNGSVTGFMVS